MSYGINQTISATDFNTYVSEIVQNYSTGLGDRGYGQAFLNLGGVRAGLDQITADHWIKLASMVTVCAQHTATPLTGIRFDAQRADSIRVGAEIQPALSVIDTNRLTPSPLARSLYSGLNIVTQSSAWNGLLEITFNVDFGSEDAARFFFNSGGEVQFALEHAAQTSDLNKSWRTLLQSTIKSVSLTAKTLSISGSGPTKSVNGGYYGLMNIEQMLLKIDNQGTNYSTVIDNVKIYAQRGNSTGYNGGNGSSISIRFLFQAEGSTAGSVLAAGTKITTSIFKADKFLNGIVTPNVVSSGFNLVRQGNTGSDTPPDLNTPGTPGKAQYPAGSIRTFIVPQYATLTVDLKGGGGSEGSSLGPQPRPNNAKPLFSPDGVAGKNATVAELNLTAFGGQGGGVYRYSQQLPAIPGSPGNGENGDINTVGGGAIGGRDRYLDHPTWFNGAAGGTGGRCMRTYIRGSLGAPSVGQALTVVTPDGGYADNLTPPAAGSYDYYPGNPGAVGDAVITWTNTSAGSVSWNTPGTYAFVVPEFTTIKFSLSGAGGGQAGASIVQQQVAGGRVVAIIGYPGDPGGNGGDARVTGLNGWNPVAEGGKGGSEQWPGGNAMNHIRGADGARYDTDGQPGFGGGVAGGSKGWERALGMLTGADDPGNGGDGALVTKTFQRGANGAPVPGQTLQCTVPAGGVGGAERGFGPFACPGSNGWITVDWS